MAKGLGFPRELGVNRGYKDGRDGTSIETQLPH